MLIAPAFDKTYAARASRLRRDKVRQQFANTIKRELPITVSIAAINILVFLAMVCAGLGVTSFDSPSLLTWGANYSPLVIQGQWFRLITSMFVHGGLMHLAVNLYGLLLAGVLLEPRLGKARFAFLYFAAGITGSFFSILFHPSTVSVGASGAIFGLYGALIAIMICQNRGKGDPGPPILNFVIYVGANLLIGSVSRGVDNAAHIGGLLCGVFLGVIFTIVGGNHTRRVNGLESRHCAQRRIADRNSRE
jgi:membrane associated rhomboid family serine protease